jgi:hypothetical protein
MSEQAQKQPWEQREGEFDVWYDRFWRYCQLGSKRSLAAIYRKESRVKSRKVASKKRNSGVSKAWTAAKTQWDWESRAAAWDADQRVQLLAEYEKRKAEILSNGFALNFERIERLGKLADLLWKELNQRDNRWLPDVKQIGQGENAERVDIVRFNSAIIEQFRKSLEDIAIEMGDRVRGVKLTGNVGVAQVTLDEIVKADSELDTWEKERFSDQQGSGNAP